MKTLCLPKLIALLLVVAMALPLAGFRPSNTEAFAQAQAQTPSVADAAMPGEEDEETPPGVHLTERTFFTQEELRELIPTAFSHEDTRPITPHPDRPMTDLDLTALNSWSRFNDFGADILRNRSPELQAWVQEYNDMGGINAFELEILYLLNNIRLEHGLTPYTLCPDLSMAARLHSQLMVQFDFAGHRDPIYGGFPGRARLFNPDRPALGENVGGGITPEATVYSWMNSPPHRELILREIRSIIGIGGVDSIERGVGVTMKVSSP